MGRRDALLRLSIMAALLLGGAMAPVFAADVKNLSVTVSSGTQANAYGGYTIEEGASALQNALTLSGPAKVLGASAGGWSRWGNAEWNTLTIRLDEDGLLGPSDIVSGGVAESEGGGAAVHNTVYIESGTVEGTVEGGVAVGINGVGDGTGDVLSNQVTMSGGTVYSVFGGETGEGNANDNVVTIKGSAAVTGKSNAVYGGYTIDGNASGNIVNIEDDADIYGEIMGGYTRAGSLISGNKVNVTGGNVNENTVYGAYTETSLGFASAGSADVTNNEVAISGGSGVAEVYGGRSYSGLAQGNKVTISAASVSGNVYGAYTAYGDALDNQAVIKGTGQAGSSDTNSVYAGFTNIGAAAGNILYIQDSAEIAGSAFAGYQGGFISSETVERNQVFMSGGSVGGDLTGGGSVMGTGNAEGNSVTLNAGSVNDDIYGGYAANGSALDNTVTIKGGTIAPAASLYSGYSTTESSGNSLNFYVKDVTVKNLKYFQTLNFYVPAGTTAGKTMLEVTDAADVSGAAIRAAVEDTTQLNPGEVINLIHTTESPILTEGTTYGMMDGKDQVTDVNLLQRTVGIKKQDANTIVLYVPGDSPITTDPGTKVIPDERESGTTLISEGSDLAVNEGFESALAAHEAGWIEDHSIKAKFIPYVVLGGHNLRYDTGSEVDSNGFNGEVGFVKRSYHEDYIDTIMPFFEYGDGNYTVHYEDARSDGDQRYIGGGILIRRDKDDGFHYEGMIRAGHFDGDLHGTVSGNHIRYDTDSNYIAAHLGLGKTYVRDTNEYDLYGKLYWARLGSDTILIKNDLGNTTYELDSVDSFRTRLGLRWTKNKNESKSYYAGIAWDYEFAGEAKAWHGDYSTPSSSLKGSSAFLELGWQTKVTEEDPWGLDLRVRGWTGKKEGFTYSATISRRF